MQLTALDWAVLAAYFVFNIGVGFYYRESAGKSIDDFFVSGRSVPWWLAGTSMIATTFVSRTSRRFADGTTAAWKKRVLPASAGSLGICACSVPLPVAGGIATAGSATRLTGEIPSTPEALYRLVERLKGRHRQLSFCYEAGPCGYGVHRLLSGLGQDCCVVAPSLIPNRPGARVKTNRRDATTLARLHRAGELTPVYVPDAATRRCPIWCGRARWKQP